MPSLFRPLVVFAILTVALATGAMAQTDSVTVVTFGPDGFSLMEPDDAPVGEGKAVMIWQMDANEWAMATLQPGDVPSEVAETMRPFRTGGSQSEAVRIAHDLLRAGIPARSEDVVHVFGTDAPASVRFEITATFSQLDLDDELVNELSEDDALRRLEVVETGDPATGRLDAQFEFDSVEALQQWKATPKTERLLEALRASVGEMRTRTNIRP